MSQGGFDYFEGLGFRAPQQPIDRISTWLNEHSKG